MSLDVQKHAFDIKAPPFGGNTDRQTGILLGVSFTNKAYYTMFSPNKILGIVVR